MHVLVTGANGHLGFNIIPALLASGHRVRGSIRSLGDPAKVERVQQHGPVEVVAAQLDDVASLRAAMDGIDAVIHTAAAYRIYAPGEEQAILSASVDGITAAMQAAKGARVRRMIVTSSVVTLPLTAPGAPPSTEDDWTTDLRVPYIRAKTLGEQQAWRLARDLDIDLVTILPGAFGGPGFDHPTPTIDFLIAIMNGAMRFGVPNLNYPYIDVRDVARAHVVALDHSATGRFIAAADCQATMAEIARALHAIDPAIPRPGRVLPTWATSVLPLVDGFNRVVFGTPRSVTPELAQTVAGKVWNVSNARARRELGWAPQVSLHDSLADTLPQIRRCLAAQA